MVRGAPLSGGVEVLQSETDRIDLAVATGALGFFLVGEQSFPRGEHLVIQPGDLRDVRRCWWWWIVEEMTQHPCPAFDGAAYDAVAAHRVDGGHTE